MSKNAFFVMALEGLGIKEGLGTGDKIASDLLITNDISIIDKNTTSSFREAIGHLEYSWFTKCGTMVYGRYQVDYDNQQVHQPFVVYNLRKVQSFLDALWLFQDNSVRFNLGFVEVKKPDAPPLISSSNLDVYYYNAKGTAEPLMLTRDDLRKVRLMRKDVWGELEEFSRWISAGSYHYQTYMHAAMRNRSFGRISRCFFFVNAARAETLTPIKLTFYSICLECLFSTDQEELSHKVSERVAFFLGTEGADKREVYDDVRMAYRVRSAMVHGDALPKKLANLDQLTQKCDDYLRQALTRIISSPKLLDMFDRQDSKTLADYLMALYLPRA